MATSPVQTDDKKKPPASSKWKWICFAMVISSIGKELTGDKHRPPQKHIDAAIKLPPKKFVPVVSPTSSTPTTSAPPAASAAQQEYTRGVAAAARQDYGTAISCFSKAILLVPDYADAFHERGLAHRRAGNLDMALTDLSETIRLQPKEADAYYNRALVFLDKGDYARVLQDTSTALELNPRYAGAFLVRGWALGKMGHFDEADAELLKAVGIDPSLTARLPDHLKNAEFVASLELGGLFRHLVITRLQDGDLSDCKLEFLCYSKDGRTKQVKEEWASWRRAESKRVLVEDTPYAAVFMHGVAFHNGRRIEIATRWEFK